MKATLMLLNIGVLISNNKYKKYVTFNEVCACVCWWGVKQHGGCMESLFSFFFFMIASVNEYKYAGNMKL